MGHRNRKGRVPARAIGTFIYPGAGVEHLITRKKAPAETKVESIRHKDKRTNIPTEQLREFKRVDVDDPTTGQIRNASTDDIACWFIETDYNGESFFVRQAYFTGADEPYEKLKRALKAESDEGAGSSLYSTTSRLFPRPQSKKIAVKVINHYGDEVLKVISV